MHRRTSVTFLFLSTAIALACATTPPHEPYQIPREQFHAKVRTIGIAEFDVPSDLENPDAVKQRFEGLIIEMLESQGFQTVPSEQVTAIWKEMETQMGGMFDPMTGELNEEKYEAARLHALQEIATRFGADAVLHPTIGVVDAEFESGTAHWCRSSQHMQSMGSVLLDGLAGMTSSGTIKATCLFVVIEDISGVNLYTDMGGIEVLGRLAVGGFEPRPQSELFIDVERNQSAVASALGSLAPPDVAAAAE